jgi:hypothetical protein
MSARFMGLVSGGQRDRGMGRFSWMPTSRCSLPSKKHDGGCKWLMPRVIALAVAYALLEQIAEAEQWPVLVGAGKFRWAKSRAEILGTYRQCALVARGADLFRAKTRDS